MDIPAGISMWLFTLVWIIEDRHPNLVDIHVDIRGFLEIHVWIWYGFSDSSYVMCSLQSLLSFPCPWKILSRPTILMKSLLRTIFGSVFDMRRLFTPDI